MLLIVNYHYIRPEGMYPYPGIHPTPPAEMESQLVELSRWFEFISLSALTRLVDQVGTMSSSLCLVTFDDGLREQYEKAVPILDRLGVPAVFFISTLPLVTKQALTVHKTHWLRATRAPGVFLQRFLEGLNETGATLDIGAVDDALSAQQYLYDDPDTRKIKYLLNHVVPHEICEMAVNSMLHKEWDEADFCQALYMTREQVRQLGKRHYVGSHSHTHRPLASLSNDELRHDLLVSKTILEEITGETVRSISYPYGGPTAVSHDVVEAAQHVGYRIGFTMERSPNCSLESPLVLARLSTNDAPGGKSPRVFVDGSTFRFADPVHDRRRTYFEESLEHPGE